MQAAQLTTVWYISEIIDLWSEAWLEAKAKGISPGKEAAAWKIEDQKLIVKYPTENSGKRIHRVPGQCYEKAPSAVVLSTQVATRADL